MQQTWQLCSLGIQSNPIQNVILNFTTEGGYGHAACLRIHNQQWYLLDSEKPGPINLDTTPSEQGWQKVSGHTYILNEELPSELELNRFDPYGTNYTERLQTGTVPDTPPSLHKSGMEIQESPIRSPQAYPKISPPQMEESPENSPIGTPTKCTTTWWSPMADDPGSPPPHRRFPCPNQRN